MGRFFSLVDTPEHKEEFKKWYRIPSDVTIEHCHLGESGMRKGLLRP